MITHKLLQKCVRHWQKQLNLKNWRIRAFLQKGIGAQGRVYWEAQLFDATILIDPTCEGPWEKVVIHELMHLHLAWLGDPKPKSELQYHVERAVDGAAWALYYAHYGHTT